MNGTGGFRNLLSSFTISNNITFILATTGLQRGGQGVKERMEGDLSEAREGEQLATSVTQLN